MNQEEAQNLVKSIFPDWVILPSSCRSEYNSDEEYEAGMKKHRELAAIVDIWNADKEQKEDW